MPNEGNEQRDEMLKRLIAIDGKTDSMEDSLAWLVKANAPHLKDAIVEKFGRGKRRAQVYLALNGSRNVKEIASHLGMKESNVSTEMKWLKRMRLVDITTASGDGIVYNKKFFDAVVGLSDELSQKFKLNDDGVEKK